jgi:putative endonuclease
MPPPSGPSRRQRLSAFGEGHARRYLEARGYEFVEANWRKSGGEIDLVLRFGSELVFGEVKTRHGEQTGRAEDSVTEAQAERMLATAEQYIAEHPEFEDVIWRCDIVAVTLDAGGRVVSVKHYPNAVVTG